MNSKWRPEGWVNRQKDFVKINVGETRAYFKNGAEEYEAGASDMLRARDKWWVRQMVNLFSNKDEYCLNPDVSCVHCDSRYKDNCIWTSWQSLKQSLQGEK